MVERAIERPHEEYAPRRRDVRARFLGLLGFVAGGAALGLSLSERISQPPIEQMTGKVVRLEADLADLQGRYNALERHNQITDTAICVNEMIQRELVGVDPIDFEDCQQEHADWLSKVEEMNK